MNYNPCCPMAHPKRKSALADSFWEIRAIVSLEELSQSLPIGGPKPVFIWNERLSPASKGLSHREFMREHLGTLIDDFRRYGDEIAVVRTQGNRRRVATYGQIAVLAGRFAAFLENRGIKQGDRVLIWAENSAEWIAAFHGCLLRGVLAVPLDATGTADFAARVAADVNPMLAVGDTVLLSQLPTGIPRMAFEDWPGALPGRQAGAIASLAADTPLEILFTSGTTGEPKGIVLTHGNVLHREKPIGIGRCSEQ